MTDSPQERLAAAVDRATRSAFTAPPHFRITDECGDPLPRSALDAIWELTEVIRLTQEYIGLPAVPGWSWYDALAKYRPELDLPALHRGSRR